ncbi:MAG TPA: hypothetical protein VKA61_00215 [Sphingomicrobium sp.]|nr:hypothetical protein [Sphingomicrobium sp.]
MRRRDFIAVAAFAAFPAAAAQIRTVAVLMPSPETDAELKARVWAFREEMRRLGWGDEALRGAGFAPRLAAETACR